MPAAVTAAPAADPVTLVNPFVGTAVGRGGLGPAATLPAGVVYLSPQTAKPFWAGYAPDQPIFGFSHTQSGGVIRVRPQTGPLKLTPPPSGKAGETASPGYYSVVLEDEGVRAELTVTERAGFHRYTFPPQTPARVLIDLTTTINASKSDHPTATSARWVSDRELEAAASLVVNRMKFTVYFVANFDRPAKARGAWLDGADRPGTEQVSGGEKQPAGVYAEFEPGSVVNLRIGISHTSVAHARRNLEPAAGLDFDDVRSRAEAIWREKFASIIVEGGTDTQRRQFYTALYHSLATAVDVTGDNGGWVPDDQTLYWRIWGLWDTFRTTNPLLTLIQPERQAGIIRTLLAVYQESGWLPDSWVYNSRGMPIQGGTNVDTVIADAIVKNLGGFDRELAYAAIRKNATEPTPENYDIFIMKGRFAPYFTLGYVPVNLYKGSNAGENPFSSGVSRTLEYAQNDHSVALAAKALGPEEDARMFRERSLNSYKLFHPETKFFWGKNAAGEWMPPADPAVVTLGWRHAFYEGSGWQYRFYMPHDMQGLITRHGGPAAFLATLDEYFDRSLHWAGNQPGFLTPWLHGYAGRPDKNVDRVRAIMAKDYKLAVAGYPGDEDNGSTSSWYVFAAMGFFPNPGQDVYLLASPVFSKVTLRLGQTGKNFIISARGLSPENQYVQSATLNGKPWDQAWFRHGDIINGAELVLTMGPKPSAWGTRKLPPSVTPAP
jgi:predicted alpha-1,2-mannosidase